MPTAPHWAPKSSNVEQPAEYVCEVRGSAAPPATAHSMRSFCRMAFYNIGWQYPDKKRAAADLAKLMRRICQQKTVHAFGISEVFNIREDDKHQLRQDIMNIILDELNADSAAQPVWIGKADVHYIFVWNTNVLTCLLYEVISCGIQEQAERKAQYFQFVILDGDTLHVIHNHSVSSDRCTLTVDRRKRICSTFWHYVADKSSAAQPAVLFGGDFNCSRFEWTLCFTELLKTESARRTVQICRSRPEGGHKGDNAIAINVRTVQETSGFGRSWQNMKEAFSDDHDVVLVPIKWGNGQESKNRAAQLVSQRVRIDARPTRAEEKTHTSTGNDLKVEHYRQSQRRWTPKSSAAEPAGVEETGEYPASVDCNNQQKPSSSASPPTGLQANSTEYESAADANAAKPEHHDANHPPSGDESDNAHFDHPGLDAQILWPDTDEECMVEAPSLSLPSAATPLYSELLGKLSEEGDEGLIESLADMFLYGSLQLKQPYGSAGHRLVDRSTPYALGLRVEHLLNVTAAQRSHQIARMASRNDPRAASWSTLIFSMNDMKEVMNTWRKDPATWMNPESFEKVNAMETRQEYHQACKKRFNTMLFELIGNKSLVETIIRFPICSAARPACILRDFGKTWQNCNDSPQAHYAREISQKQTKPRLSKMIHGQQMRADHGRWIADWLAEDWNNWYHLNAADQNLWFEFQNGNMGCKMAELRAQKQPKFSGVAERIALELQPAV